MEIGKSVKIKAWVLLKSSVDNTPVSSSVNGLVYCSAKVPLSLSINTIMSWT